MSRYAFLSVYLVNVMNFCCVAFPSGPEAISKALELAVSSFFLGRDLLVPTWLFAFGGSGTYPERGTAAVEASLWPCAVGSLSWCSLQQPGTTLFP